MDVLLLVSEPRRRELLRMCWNEERSVAELHEAMPEVTLGAISQHLGKLREAGVIEVRKDGRSRLYRTRTDVLAPLRNALDGMWVAGLDRLESLVKEQQ